MKYILFDDENRINLLPHAFTKSIADFRIGTTTIKEKWENLLDEEVGIKTVSYLQPKYKLQESSSSIYINSAICPTSELIAEIKQLRTNETLKNQQVIMAYKGSGDNQIQCNLPFIHIKNLWDIFKQNEDAIIQDIKNFSISLSKPNIEGTIIYGNHVSIHPTAKVRGAILNSETGPIIVEEGAEIMEGSVIRGPFVLGKHSIAKLSTKVYGATTIGPHCRIGGEINNSVLFGYSNKGHDGFLGNSVLGEWCNLGADTNNSNLKNNYSNVQVWSYKTKEYESTGLQFCGLMMADHSKTSINTMLNTGTVVGVCANIFGGDFPLKFVPSFAWGGRRIKIQFKLEKAFEVAEKVMERRNVTLTEIDKNILKEVFIQESKHYS